MSVKNFLYAQCDVSKSITVAVTPGSEPDLGLAVDLDGAVGVNARGVVVNSREGYLTVAISGIVPVKVEDAATIAKGAPVSANASGEVITATGLVDLIGYALEAVSVASSDYILVALNVTPNF